MCIDIVTQMTSLVINRQNLYQKICNILYIYIIHNTVTTNISILQQLKTLEKGDLQANLLE